MFGQDLPRVAPGGRSADVVAEMAEMEVCRAQIRFQTAMVAAADQAIVGTDGDGGIVHWNDAAEAIYGWTSEEALGRGVAALFEPQTGRDVDGDESLSRLLAGEPWTGDLLVQTKSGVLIPVMLSTTVVYDEGVRVGTISVASDISARLRSEEAAALLSAIVASSRDAIFSANAAGTIDTWNGGASTLFGYEEHQMIGRHLGVVLPIGDDETMHDVFERALRGDPVDSVDACGKCADGSEVRVSISVSPIRARSGTITGTSMIARDVTERVALLHRIDVDRRRLAAAQASAKLGSFEVDLRTGGVARSDEMCRIMGLDPTSDASAGFGLKNIHPDDHDQLRQLLAEAAALTDEGEPAAGRNDGELTYRIVRPDGEVRWVLSQATVLRGPDSDVLAGTMLDVTDRHDADVALVHRATCDALTDLPNRASLHHALVAALSSADSDHPVALAVIDVDRFKLVTDGLRHSSGDQALRALTARFCSGLRPTDVVFSMSGDGFAVVRTGVQSLEDAHDLGNDIMVLLDEPLVLDDRDLLLTVSVGVTLSTLTDTPQSLLRDADDAMYQAKNEGRDQVKVFDHHARCRAHRRQSIAEALPAAFENDELHLEFQPVIELSTGEVAGFEALLRWNHVVLGSIPPAEFIPVAEATGLILRIGVWVLDRSLQQLAEWLADPRVGKDLSMAINVSAQQLGDPRLVDQVRDATVRAGVPASSVHLEITESVLMDRVDNALATIVELQSAGFSVSIDDFGTGYSSLSYLSRLPIDMVKIDRSFVGGLGASATGHDPSIVRAMIALADALELNVVAEGVELEAQLDFLTELGCTYGQGFLWSRSLIAADALMWMFDHPGQSKVLNSPHSVEQADPMSPDMVGAAIIEIAQISGRRRRRASDPTNVLRFDSLEIGLTAGRAWLAGRDVELTTKEFELLAFMAQHPGETFSRKQLLQEVWHSSPTWQSPSTVTEHIHRLRNRIELDPSRPRLICTVRSSGYCFGPPNSASVAS
ncbi:MAG: EAL domain-containing protein [Ilumatobacteraceae bacterium]